MNTIHRSLIAPAVELNKPNGRSTERILNTIRPVTSVFTAMDAAQLVRINVTPQVA